VRAGQRARPRTNSRRAPEPRSCAAPARIVDAYAGSGRRLFMRAGRPYGRGHRARSMTVDRMRSQLVALRRRSRVASRIISSVTCRRRGDLNPPRRAGRTRDRRTGAIRRACPVLRELRSGHARARPRATSGISPRRGARIRHVPQTAHVETLCELEPVSS
jgi:hypothetical protein